MKPIKLMWRRTLHLSLSLALVSSFTTISSAQEDCSILLNQSVLDDQFFVLDQGDCSDVYTIPLVNSMEGTSSGVCTVYLASVNGYDLSGINPYGTDTWIVANNVNTITLPVGENELHYTVTDHGPMDPEEDMISQIVTYELDPFGLACNDGIQVSMGEACQAIITPDMVLEGSYCYEAYTVAIEDENGLVSTHDDALGGAIISAPGDYTVTITDLEGNSCWSTITAEDKVLPPITCCDLIELACYQTDYRPGAASSVAFNSESYKISVTPNGEGYYQEVFATTAENNSVLDVIVELDLYTSDVDSVSIWLAAPETITQPTPDTLLIADFTTGTDPCTRDNIDVTLDDSAFYALDLSDCGDNPSTAYQGEYQSLMFNLSQFVGSEIAGGWTLIIVNDSDFATVSGSATVKIEETADVICFPEIEKYDTNGDLITPIWELIGNEDYEVSFPGNNCSNIYASYTDVATTDECTGTYLSGFTRTWVFSTDNEFVNATSCTQDFYDLQLELDDVVFPPDFDGIEEPSFTCSEYNANPSIIDPILGVVGYPSHVDAIQDAEEICGNFNVTYEDLTLPLCGISFKLLRKYTVIDWCTGDIEEHTQVIKVEDDSTLFAVGQTETVILTNDQHDCTTDIFIDPTGDGPNGYGYQLGLLSKGCSEITSITVEYKSFPGAEQPCNAADVIAVIEDEDFVSASSLGNGEWAINDIEAGCVWIRYTVEDECGNIATAASEVFIEDGNAPNPVCLEYTIAAFGIDGGAKVKAESFDNGSFDNCGVVDFKARIMGSGTDWTEKVSFGCGQYTCDERAMVELVVIDQEVSEEYEIDGDFSDLISSGINYSICMVEVGFQDKIAPRITNGPVSVLLACDAIIETIDELENQFSLNWEVEDNCTVNTPEVVTNVSFPLSANECGGGVYSISWEVSDDCDNTDSWSASVSFQTASTVSSVNFPHNDEKIKIFSCPEFDVNGDPVSPSPEEVQIAAGSDVIYPTVAGQSCNSTAHSYEDQFFFNDTDEGVCLKMVRTWSLIDWCAYNNSNGASGTFSESQVVTYIETPDLDIITPGVIECEDVLYSNGCRPSVKVELGATDACDNLDWIITVVECGDDGLTSTFSDPSFVGEFLHGDIEVFATVSDKCGNTQTESFTIAVPDCLAPTPYCIGETIVTIGADGTAEVWANDFDLGSYDDYPAVDNCPTCDEAGDSPLIYGFDADGSTQVVNFDCSDIPNGVEASIELDVYVIDPNGAQDHNADFCTVTVILQDNLDNGVDSENQCSDTPGGGNENSRIAGNVHMYDNRSISESTVTLTSNQPEYPVSIFTSTTGDYDFDNLTSGYAYEVNTEKTDEILNGVSTLDILLIQRHLLNLTPFTSPYQYIAADANNSLNITAADMVAIRNVILERTNAYVNGQDSWRFLDGSQSFTNPTNPFPYDEEIALFLSGDHMNQDFIAVKIGDINNDAEALFNGSTLTEVRGVPLNMTINSASYVTGEEVIVDVTSSNFEDILGMQFTLNSDESLVFERFETGLLDLTNESAGLSHVDEGKVSVSWNTTAPINADKDDVLFRAIYTAIESGTTDHILVDNSITTDEAYNSNLDVINIIMTNADGQATQAGYSLDQNRPNPFNSETVITFTLPASQQATLTIYDMSGRALETFSDVYGKGSNEIRVESSNWNSTNGVYYYQLNSEGYTATKKMILTD